MEKLKTHVRPVSRSLGRKQICPRASDQDFCFREPVACVLRYHANALIPGQRRHHRILNIFGTDSGLHLDVQLQAHLQNTSKSVYSRVKSPKPIPNTA